MRRTPTQLTKELNDSIKDFSSTLRPLAEEAGRRLTDGQGDASLKEAFRYTTHILAFIEKEKPKKPL